MIIFWYFRKKIINYAPAVTNRQKFPDEGVTLLAPEEMWLKDAEKGRSRLMLELGADNVKITENGAKKG